MKDVDANKGGVPIWLAPFLSDIESIEGVLEWAQAEEQTVNVGPAIEPGMDVHFESSAGWVTRLLRAMLSAAPAAPVAADEKPVCVHCNGRGVVSLGSNADTKALDWLEEQAVFGCVTLSLELDGGVHVTVDPVGGEQKAARNVNSVREGIAALTARKTDGKTDGKTVQIGPLEDIHGAVASDGKGVTDSRCNYLAQGACNKCGRVHDGGIPPFLAPSNAEVKPL